MIDSQVSSITLCWRLASTIRFDYCRKVRPGMGLLNDCHATFLDPRTVQRREWILQTDCFIASLCSSIADVDRKE
jgi:hypothetical protein